MVDRTASLSSITMMRAIPQRGASRWDGRVLRKARGPGMNPGRSCSVALQLIPQADRDADSPRRTALDATPPVGLIEGRPAQGTAHAQRAAERPAERPFQRRGRPAAHAVAPPTLVPPNVDGRTGLDTPP